MKKALASLLLLVSAASASHAQYPNFIGMYADGHATFCDSNLPVYRVTVIYFFADMYPDELTHLYSVQFKLENPIVAGVDALVTFHWLADQVIGDWATDLTLVFDPALEGPCAFIGSVEYIGLADIGDNHDMYIVPAEGQSDIWLVNDDTGLPVACMGGGFTFNCSGGCGYCRGIANCNTPSDEATISRIKALY